MDILEVSKFSDFMFENQMNRLPHRNQNINRFKWPLSPNTPLTYKKIKAKQKKSKLKIRGQF